MIHATYSTALIGCAVNSLELNPVKGDYIADEFIFVDRHYNILSEYFINANSI